MSAPRDYAQTGDLTAEVRHAASSSDASYDGTAAEAPPLTVTVEDVDVAALVVDAGGGGGGGGAWSATMTVEEGADAARVLRVRLATAPLADVTVTVEEEPLSSAVVFDRHNSIFS